MKQELYFLLLGFRLGAACHSAADQTGNRELVYPLALPAQQRVSAEQTQSKQSVKQGWERGTFPAGEVC